MKSWKSQKIPMHFFQTKDGAKHCKRYLGLNPPFDLIAQPVPAPKFWTQITCFQTLTRSLLPGLSTYVRSQNYFNRCTYVNTYGFRVAYTPVFFVRACAWLSAPENSTENHFVVLRELRKRKRNECSLKLFFFPTCQRARGIHDPWNRREEGHSIILMNFPMDSVSKSPQE